MFLSFRNAGVIALLTPLLLQCGGRSAISGGDAGELKACTHDDDCLDGNQCVTWACVSDYCAVVAQKDCDDGDYCTDDSCEESNGQCIHRSKSRDNDQDGSYAPLPGKTGPAACGDDCNDAIASVHPGARELCDGFDNNCDGRVDEGTLEYQPLSSSAVRITDDSFIDGGPTGLAYNGSSFGLAFTGSSKTNTYQGYFTGYDAWTTPVVPVTNTTQTSKDSFAGPLVWTGSVFGTAWEIRGERGYDIYFNELDARGKKMGPDLRVSNGSGFSIQPTMHWNGTEYWVAWSDDSGGDVFRIFGRRIDGNRQLASDVLELTPPAADARTPILLRSNDSNLLLYLSADKQQIRGRLLNSDMTPASSEVQISGDGASSYSADWVQDRFVVAWCLEGEQPGDAIWATTIDALGTVLQNPVAITTGSNFARTPNVLSLGDRFALAWADDRGKYGRYGIRMSTYNTALTRLSSVQTLAETTYDCIDPTLASGGHGLGLVYRERTYGQTGFPYFLGLTCDYRLE
jgi:hypothetical protein